MEYPGNQYEEHRTIQDRETELDMDDFLENIGVDELPSFDSSSGNILESTVYGDKREKAIPQKKLPPRKPASKISTSPGSKSFEHFMKQTIPRIGKSQRKSPFSKTSPSGAPFMTDTDPQYEDLLNQNLPDFLDDMDVDDLPSFDSDYGTTSAAASTQVPHYGPAKSEMKKKRVDTGGFLDDADFDFSPRRDGEIRQSSPYAAKQTKRIPAQPSRRMPMTAFLESPEKTEIKFTPKDTLAVPGTSPQQMKKNKYGLSGMDSFLEMLEAEESPETRTRDDTAELLAETEDYFSKYDAEVKHPLPPSPRSRILAEMFPSAPYPPKSPERPASPTRPPVSQDTSREEEPHKTLTHDDSAELLERMQSVFARRAAAKQSKPSPKIPTDMLPSVPSPPRSYKPSSSAYPTRPPVSQDRTPPQAPPTRPPASRDRTPPRAPPTRPPVSHDRTPPRAPQMRKPISQDRTSSRAEEPHETLNLDDSAELLERMQSVFARRAAAKQPKPSPRTPTEKFPSSPRSHDRPSSRASPTGPPVFQGRIPPGVPPVSQARTPPPSTSRTAPVTQDRPSSPPMRSPPREYPATPVRPMAAHAPRKIELPARPAGWYSPTGFSRAFPPHVLKTPTPITVPSTPPRVPPTAPATPVRPKPGSARRQLVHISPYAQSQRSGDAHQPLPDDLIEFNPSVYTDYLDFIGHPEHSPKKDLMTFQDNWDWTKSEKKKEDENKLKEFQEVERLIRIILKELDPQNRYIDVESPLTLFKAVLRKFKEKFKKADMMQNLMAKKHEKKEALYSLGQRIQLMESNLRDASRYLDDITQLWNQKKEQYLNRVRQERGQEQQQRR